MTVWLNFGDRCHSILTRRANAPGKSLIIMVYRARRSVGIENVQLAQSFPCQWRASYIAGSWTTQARTGLLGLLQAGLGRWRCHDDADDVHCSELCAVVAGERRRVRQAPRSICWRTKVIDMISQRVNLSDWWDAGVCRRRRVRCVFSFRVRTLANRLSSASFKSAAIGTH